MKFLRRTGLLFVGNEYVYNNLLHGHHSVDSVLYVGVIFSDTHLRNLRQFVEYGK